MKPTLENLKIFKKSIIQKKILKPNFYDAKKVPPHKSDHFLMFKKLNNF